MIRHLLAALFLTSIAAAANAEPVTTVTVLFDDKPHVRLNCYSMSCRRSEALSDAAWQKPREQVTAQIPSMLRSAGVAVADDAPMILSFEISNVSAGCVLFTCASRVDLEAKLRTRDGKLVWTGADTLPKRGDDEEFSERTHDFLVRLIERLRAEGHLHAN